MFVGARASAGVGSERGAGERRDGGRGNSQADFQILVFKSEPS